MNYYLVSNDTNLEKIGAFMQCKGIPSGDKYDYKWFNQPNSMTRLTNRAYPQDDPDLVFELKEDAFLTDIISPSNISAVGILLNKRTKDLLRKFNLADHKYYPAKVIVNGSQCDYFWLHFVKNDFSGLDLEKSIFYNSLFKTDKHKRFKLNSYEDALKRKTPLYLFMGIEKLVLDKKSAFSFNEIFYLPAIEEIIINEDVLNEFLTQHISGFKYRLVE